MRIDQIARVVGYADTQLLNTKDPFADSNRRITILVLPLSESKPAEERLRNGPMLTNNVRRVGISPISAKPNKPSAH